MVWGQPGGRRDGSGLEAMGTHFGANSETWGPEKAPHPPDPFSHPQDVNRISHPPFLPPSLSGQTDNVCEQVCKQ